MRIDKMQLYDMTLKLWELELLFLENWFDEASLSIKTGALNDLQNAKIIKIAVISVYIPAVREEKNPNELERRSWLSS